MFFKKILFFLIPTLFLSLLSFNTTALAIEYAWKDRAGNQHTLADLKGKPVLLHFWASWCPPCKKEMPELIEWSQQHPEITFIPVSLDGKFDKAVRYIQDKNLKMSALHGDQSMSIKLGVYGLPASLLIDAEGNILRKETGAKPWSNTAYSDEVMTTFKK